MASRRAFTRLAEDDIHAGDYTIHWLEKWLEAREAKHLPL